MIHCNHGKPHVLPVHCPFLMLLQSFRTHTNFSRLAICETGPLHNYAQEKFAQPGMT